MKFTDEEVDKLLQVARSARRKTIAEMALAGESFEAYPFKIPLAATKAVAEAATALLETRIKLLEAQLDFCAKAVSQLRESDDGFEIRLVDESPLAQLRGGKWYKGGTLREAITAAMEDLL